MDEVFSTDEHIWWNHSQLSDNALLRTHMQDWLLLWWLRASFEKANPTSQRRRPRQRACHSLSLHGSRWWRLRYQCWRLTRPGQQRKSAPLDHRVPTRWERELIGRDHDSKLWKHWHRQTSSGVLQALFNGDTDAWLWWCVPDGCHSGKNTPWWQSWRVLAQSDGSHLRH